MWITLSYAHHIYHACIFISYIYFYTIHVFLFSAYLSFWVACFFQFCNLILKSPERSILIKYLYLYLYNRFFLIFFFCFLFVAPRRGGECSKVVEPKYCSTDLHYNQTFVLEKDQSSKTALQSIKDSKCSPELEKYLCYTTVPPCKPNDLSVFVPCRSICEQVGLHFNSLKHSY